LAVAVLYITGLGLICVLQSNTNLNQDMPATTAVAMHFHNIVAQL